MQHVKEFKVKEVLYHAAVTDDRLDLELFKYFLLFDVMFLFWINDSSV